MPVSGTKIVAKNIKAYGGGFLRTVNKEMRVVRDILDKKVTQNMSRTDYSVEQLSLLDHPFASRHGDEGRHVYEPYYMIHKRSGSLLRAKEKGILEASFQGSKLEAAAFVKIDADQAEHALYVVFGTSRMIPRPVLVGSRDQVVDKAVGHLKNRLKNFNFSFRGGS